jgi:imidazole glycerol-phosphate synthase subunit HisH
MPIALLDYGAGNLTSVRKGFAAAGAELFTPRRPSELERASAVVVPGVGHFAATSALSADWKAAIREALAAGRPLLGICLGLQWLYDGSDESPEVPGLGVIRGTCTRLAASPPLKVPHVGWNSLAPTRPSPLLAGVEPGATVYFTHTFAAPVTSECVATSTHGVTFCAAVSAGNAHGVQFHPEKSGDAGLRVLRNFVDMADAL